MRHLSANPLDSQFRSTSSVRSFPIAMTSDFSESLLSKRFGSETVNFFAGSKLNRYSFKRTEHKFLSQSLLHPTTRFVAFNNLDPLADKSGRVKFLSYDEVKEIIGNPYEHPDDVRLRQWCSSDQEVILIYLGCDESHDTDVKGLPYFAVDVTPAPMSREAEKTAFIEAQTGKGLEFRNVRVGVELEHEEAAIVAMGRSLIDWNVRYIHCPGCGGKTLGVWAGAKRQCPEIDKVAGPRAPCVSRKGLHNYAYPRTDAVIIMGILSADGEKLLMGRQKVWPKGMYSCLAGKFDFSQLRLTFKDSLSLESHLRKRCAEKFGKNQV